MTSRLNRHRASGEKQLPKLGAVTLFELCVVEPDYKLRDGSQRRDTNSSELQCEQSIYVRIDIAVRRGKRRTREQLLKRSEVPLEVNLVIWCQFTDSDCVSL